MMLSWKLIESSMSTPIGFSFVTTCIIGYLLFTDKGLQEMMLVGKGVAPAFVLLAQNFSSSRQSSPGSPSRSSASLSEGWWEKMLVGGGAEAEILEPVVKILD